MRNTCAVCDICSVRLRCVERLLRVVCCFHDSVVYFHDVNKIFLFLYLTGISSSGIRNVEELIK